MEKIVLLFVGVPQDNHRFRSNFSSGNCIPCDIEAADIVFMLVYVSLVEFRLILLAVQSLCHYYSQSSLMVDDPILAVELEVVSTIKAPVSQHIVQS